MAAEAHAAGTRPDTVASEVEALGESCAEFGRELRRYLMAWRARQAWGPRGPHPPHDLRELRSWSGWSAKARSILDRARDQASLERLLSEPRLQGVWRWFEAWTKRVRRESLEELAALRGWVASRQQAAEIKLVRRRPA